MKLFSYNRPYIVTFYKLHYTKYYQVQNLVRNMTSPNLRIALDLGQNVQILAGFVLFRRDMCKNIQKCANQCAKLAGWGGMILFVLYTCLHLKQGYLSTKRDGGMENNRVVSLICVMTFRPLDKSKMVDMTSHIPLMTSDAGGCSLHVRVTSTSGTRLLVNPRWWI